jgi:hypothetical protein
VLEGREVIEAHPQAAEYAVGDPQRSQSDGPNGGRSPLAGPALMSLQRVAAVTDPGHTQAERSAFPARDHDACEREHPELSYVTVPHTLPRSATLLGGRPEDRTPSGLWPSDHVGVAAVVGTL